PNGCKARPQGSGPAARGAAPRAALAAAEKGRAPELAPDRKGTGRPAILDRPRLRASTGSAHGAPDFPDQVGLLPREAPVLVGRPTEVAVGCGAPAVGSVGLTAAAVTRWSGREQCRALPFQALL